jgi:hypothetical protein
MTPRDAFAPLRGERSKRGSEEQQEDDFAKLLQEFAYSVERRDKKAMQYSACELKRMFREKNAAGEPQL